MTEGIPLNVNQAIIRECAAHGLSGGIYKQCVAEKKEAYLESQKPPEPPKDSFTPKIPVEKVPVRREAFPGATQIDTKTLPDSGSVREEPEPPLTAVSSEVTTAGSDITQAGNTGITSCDKNLHSIAELIRHPELLQEQRECNLRIAEK